MRASIDKAQCEPERVHCATQLCQLACPRGHRLWSRATASGALAR